MKSVLLRRAIKLNREHKRRKGWQRVVSVLAAGAVFVTTYALILPAITMERKAVCGFEAHEHTEACYEQQPVYQLQCTLGDTGDIVLHSHNEACFDGAGNRLCTLPEIVAHTHSESCYETRDVVCELPEGEGHTHSDDCAAAVSVQVCILEESQPHTHGEGCYDAEGNPVCALPDGEGHTHGEGCYESQAACTLPETAPHTHSDGCTSSETVQVCALEEYQLHTHEESCYDTEGNLTCTLPQVIAHDHAACRVATEQTVPVLTCQIPEHIHEDACYPLEEDTGMVYLCASGEHTHGDGCVDEAGVLTCSIPVHTHEAACLVADLDLTADVETQPQWEVTLKSVELTGNWPADVLAIAATQEGYRESARNVTLEDGELKGYTRYGQWYGMPYGDWCAMFAAFCMHYAGVEDVPIDARCAEWITALEEKGLYHPKDTYEPKPGDLIFFDFDLRENPDGEVRADHVGFVTEMIPATEESTAQIKTIEGNASNQVSRVTYEHNDPAIIGYGVMPEGNITILTHQGADYTVSVSFGPEAGIPEAAQLTVEEILPGTDEYNTYYLESVAALVDSGTAVTAQTLTVSFARFFDITFLVDGVAVEPAAPVDVKISYAEAVVQSENESSVAVHFTDDGVEVLDAKTSQTTEAEDAQVDTFTFTQDSFSVVGTMLSSYVRAVPSNTATRISPNSVDGSGNTLYVLYTQIGGNWYAIDGNGYPVAVTVTGNTVTLGADATDNLFWSFTRGSGTNVYVIGNLGTGRHLHSFRNSNTDAGTTTSGAWSSTLRIEGDYVRIQGANNYYPYFPSATAVSQPTNNWNTASRFYIGSVGQYLNVWFDGTVGGMMSYYGAANTNIPAIKDSSGTATITLPETWQSSTKYDYVLQGWYDINTQTYYAVDPSDSKDVTATITDDTVFYADWVAATYDVGQNNEDVVASLDTNNFITTYVFDYNVLFNVLSQRHTGSISSTGHSETWSIYNNGETVPYGGGKSLGFVFVDYDNGGDISYANGRDDTNVNHSAEITAGILQEVANNSGQDLLDLLFNPNTQVIGKNYVGQGNYLFQYMDSTTANYDGEHDGYYYLDARLNAASYNQTLQRFYLYDYLERTSDSRKDGGAGAYSDLLPFNSPYICDADQVDHYVDSIMTPGYEYDAKDGASSYQEYNNVADATTNYFFGLRSDIEFFLPNNAGTQDEYGNYGNISTRGEHMVFDFHGDDDVWVFVDGKLVLDIGGLHGIMHGNIDFSTGTVTVGRDGAESTVSFEEMGLEIKEGTHTMQVYYMERGSSQSNCAIYFNIAPRYDLEITKEDIVTADKLDGAVFAIYNDEALTSPAQLWVSEEAYNEDMKDDHVDNATNQFTVVDGVARCWGISAGKTYYIAETTPPPGYPETDDIIRITLNNRGTATIETTTLHGPNEEATEGFAVIKQDINETLKIVALTVTNQLDGDTTEVRVQKTWAAGSENLPQSITVYLTADGVPVGRRATLNEGNGWAYTWTGLPKYKTEGVDQEIVYEVQEVLVPDYITTQGDSVKVEKYEDWIKVEHMSDSNTYLLVHNGKILTYSGSGFGWADLVLDADGTANLDSLTAIGAAAQWSVTTDHDGFHLKNGLGYTLTFNPATSRFEGNTSDAVTLNQVIYYLNSRLVVHDHDVYYQFGSNGSAVADDGLAFTLYQQEIFTGWMTGITNTPVEEEDQTFVEVTKSWYDGNENHNGESVTIRLYADGQDTGRFVILSASNNWTGGFYDLPYYQADGTTKVNYTVVEDSVKGYEPAYSDGVELTGLPITLWQDAPSIAAGGTYRFVRGSYALAVATDNSVTVKANDLDDTYQHWQAVANSSGNVVLKNVGSGRYLYMYNNTLYTTSNLNSATVVTMTAEGYVRIGSRYLEVGAGYVQTTGNTQNLSGQKTLYQVTTTGKPGTGYTVINSPAAYRLPNTGSVGTSHFTFGGLLLLAAAALMYVIYFGRKRKKGGA
ncbi:MAG: Cna B-type domain-containing protein [Oscillospiraceae bacterium]|nr:Cna B-type domain-containing protein [Oscillospiraceae bacterium]